VDHINDVGSPMLALTARDELRQDKLTGEAIGSR
jgi:hypothetical protein